MKQLHNIFTGLLLILGLLIASPAVAQEDDITPQEQKENTVDVKSIVFGIRKDGTGYSKGKDNGCDGLYQPDHGRGTGAYR